MTPKEKATQLCDAFYQKLPLQRDVTTTDGDLSWEYNSWQNAKECALIAIDEILIALDSFGYTGCMYDDFETRHILYTDDKDPSEYWQEVKQEIEKL